MQKVVQSVALSFIIFLHFFILTSSATAASYDKGIVFSSGKTSCANSSSGTAVRVWLLKKVSSSKYYDKDSALKALKKSKKYKSKEKTKLTKDIKKANKLCKLPPIINLTTVSAPEGAVRNLSAAELVKNPAGVAFSVIQHPANGELNPAGNLVVWNANHSIGSAQGIIAASNQYGTSHLAILFSTGYQENSAGRTLRPYHDQLTPSEAAHLSRALFNDPGVDTALITQGLNTTIEAGTNQSHGGTAISNPTCDPTQIENAALTSAARYFGSYCDGNHRCFRDFWDTRINRSLWTQEAVRAYFLYKFRYGCNPLKETMALFWHEHFSTSVLEANSDRHRHQWIKSHIDKFYQYSFDFRTLLSSMHGDGLMLKWLDNENNYMQFTSNKRVHKANENYAREVMELFTMGTTDVVTNQANYNDLHIKKLAEALTGWQTKVARQTSKESCECPCPGGDINACDTACRANPGLLTNCAVDVYDVHEPFFEDKRWMPGPSNGILMTNITLFEGLLSLNPIPYGSSNTHNMTIPPEYAKDTVTNALLAHPATARYLAQKLYARFINAKITAEDLGNIEELAQMIREDNYDITRAVQTIFKSEAFFHFKSTGAKSPLESFIGTLRRFNLPLDISNAVWDPNNPNSTKIDLVGSIGWWMNQIGHQPGTPPSVFGFNERGAIHGNKVLDGTKFINMGTMLNQRNALVEYLTYITEKPQLWNFDWNDFLPEDTLQRNDPEIVVDRMVNLSGLTLNTAQKQELVKYLTSIKVAPQDPAQAYPWNPYDPVYVKTKLSGLISILAELDASRVY
ncbi:DUF1800 family protein [bacterium]|nr:DUF1800 family protein [bacterium]